MAGRDSMNDMGPPSDPVDPLGANFRWSWDEIKSVFKRPFSGANRSSGGTDARSSLFRGQGFRWSFEDLKQKIRSFGSIGRNSGNKGTVAEPEGGGKRKRGKQKLTKEERERRRQDRLQARREKKSKREKERRENVNVLFDQLGNKVGISPDNKKGARLSILAAAVDELRKKKGLEPHSPGNDDDMDLDLDLDLDLIDASP